MKIITLTEKEFDEYASTHKYASYFQTSAYAKTESSSGYSIHYIGFSRGENRLVGASMLLYRKAFFNYKYAYAPRGFLIDYTDSYIVGEITSALKRLLYKQNFLFIKIDPPIIASERDTKGNIIYMSDTINNILDNLKQNDYAHMGFNKYFETTNPRWCAFAKLSKKTAALYNSLNNELKQEIKDATNMGVKVILDKSNDINSFYNIIRKKYRRKSKKYFIDLYNNFKNDNKIDIYYTMIDTTVFIKNSQAMYNTELENNQNLANIIQSNNYENTKREEIITNKMVSDKLLNRYKNNVILSTELFKKYPKGILLGCTLIIHENMGVSIVVQSSDEQYSNFYFNSITNWELIKKYSNDGYKYINLGAAIGDFNKNNKYTKMVKDKLQFNSTVIEYMGELDLIINPTMYKIYKRKTEK